MNTIEQGFLVPTSPQVIWRYISDINNNPRWQLDCRDVSLLTPEVQGRGMRWRQTTKGGRDQVIQVTAWYDKVGYEYKIVDGSPYAENVGRIKLHETPDGTEIIWEFHYELGGPLGGLRNALTTRRTLENNIAESLWRLWDYVSSIPEEEREGWVAKSLMRDAPDVEARAQYQSRHQETEQPAPVTDPSNNIVIDEPPIEQDDTRPRPAAASAHSIQDEAPTETVDEPEFLRNVTPDDFRPSDESAAAFDLQEKTDSSELHYLEFDAQATLSDQQDEQPDWDAPTDPNLKVTEAPITPSPTQPETSGETEALSPVADSTTEPPQTNDDLRTTEVMPTAPELPRIADDPADDLDSSQVSVFDLFGVQKPSETQENPAVKLDEDSPIQPDPEETDPTPVSVVEVEATPTAPARQSPLLKPLENPIRGGLRVRLRQGLVKVRRPGQN